MLIACRWSPGYARDGDSLLFNGIRKEIGTNIDNGHMKESCARVCNILHKITSLRSLLDNEVSQNNPDIDTYIEGR